MWTQEIDVASALARRAGALALEIAKRHFEVEDKANDEGPVTEADRALNTLILDGLRAAFPEDAVIGEESAKTGMVPGPRTWYVDPIDGTIDYIESRPEWAVMIGLAVEGEAKVGVVYQPNSDRLYVGAEGLASWRDESGSKTPLQARTLTSPEEAVAVLSRNHPDPKILELLGQIGVTQSLQHGSVGMKLAVIAEGRSEVYVNLSGKCYRWDCVAGDAILRGAGGRVITMTGDDLRYDGPALRVKEAFLAVSDGIYPAVAATCQRRLDLDPSH